MYVGKRNLLDALKLLKQTKVERVDLILANGQTILATKVLLEGNQVYATNTDGMWVMLPDDEVVGFAVELGPVSHTKTLPEVLASLRVESSPGIAA